MHTTADINIGSGRWHYSPARYAIRVSLFIALALHAIVLGLLKWPQSPTERNTRLTVEMLWVNPDPPISTEPASEVPPEYPAELRDPPDTPETTRPSKAMTQATDKPPPSDGELLTAEFRGPREMDKAELASLRNSLLLRQFISEESVTQQIFGPSIERPEPVHGKSFHYPGKENMISYLEKSMPDLPFEYTPGLIYFAYDPGLKGELQRFWDVITPEFGWTTDRGTEVKCVWMLVMAGCGWKQSP